MKKYLYIVFAMILISNAVCDATTASICSEFVRFHIVANSDSAYDQSIKLRLRDHILREIQGELLKCSDKSETLELLKKSQNKIRESADLYLAANGCDMKTRTYISNGHFPQKDYGDFILPEGNYDSFRIVIGEGKGKNFFCVMFPPACVSGEMTDNVNEILNKRKITYKFKLFSKE